MNVASDKALWRGPWGWGVPLVTGLLLAWVGLNGINQSVFLAINHWGTQFGPVIWPLITTCGDSLVVFSLALLLVGRYPKLLWSLMLTALMAGVIATPAWVDRGGCCVNTS